MVTQVLSGKPVSKNDTTVEVEIVISIQAAFSVQGRRHVQICTPLYQILFDPVTSVDLFIFGPFCCYRSTHPCLLRETDAWQSFITGLARELQLFFLHAAGNSPSGSCDLLMGHYQQRGTYHV